MKQTRMIYKRLNFASGGVGRAKLRSSVMHSLRMQEILDNPDLSKSAEWNDSLKKENLIYINDEIISLDDLSNDDRVSLMNEIIGEESPKNRKKQQTNKGNYRHKLKKAIDTETDKGNTAGAAFFQNILDTNENQKITMPKISDFDNIDVARKKQKLSMLCKYVKAHNELSEQTKNKNSIGVQEGFFKFPEKWKVKNLISKNEYIEFTKDFLTEHFPDYKIHAIVLHDDERMNNEKVSPHPHYFLSAQNEKTKNHDLIREQTVVLNKYIERKNLDLPEDEKIEIFPADRGLRRAESQRFGELFQRLFYEEVNSKLLVNKELKAVIADETERRSAARKQMSKENNLPKRERSHNYLTRSLELVEQAEMALAEAKMNVEDAENNHNAITDENDNLIEQQKELINSLDDGTEKLSSLTKSIEKQKEEEKNAKKSKSEAAFVAKITIANAHELNEENVVLREQLVTAAEELEKTKSYVNEFKKSFSNIFDQVAGQILDRVAFHLMKKPELFKKYTKDILENYAKIAPLPLRDFCKAAAMTTSKYIENDDLVKRLERIDKKNYGETENTM